MGRAGLPFVLALALAACADVDPPALMDVTQVGDTTDSIGPYLVSAVARDDRGIESVTLYYTGDLTGDIRFAAVEMRPVSVDLYEGEIGGFPPGSTVRYFVEAKDSNANYARAPSAQGDFYQFRVFDSD